MVGLLSSMGTSLTASPLTSLGASALGSISPSGILSIPMGSIGSLAGSAETLFASLFGSFGIDPALVTASVGALGTFFSTSFSTIATALSGVAGAV